MQLNVVVTRHSATQNLRRASELDYAADTWRLAPAAVVPGNNVLTNH